MDLRPSVLDDLGDPGYDRDGLPENFKKVMLTSLLEETDLCRRKRTPRFLKTAIFQGHAGGMNNESQTRKADLIRLILKKGRRQ